MKNYSTKGYAASGVVHPAQNRIMICWGYNSGGAQFLQFFDAKAVPANGAAPVIVFALAATSNFQFDLRFSGTDVYSGSWEFLSGLCWSNSSTGDVKTIGSADCFVNILTV